MEKMIQKHEHRGEVFNTLATIGLEFALLHERVCVEKMKAFVWPDICELSRTR